MYPYLYRSFFQVLTGHRPGRQRERRVAPHVVRLRGARLEAEGRRLAQGETKAGRAPGRVLSRFPRGEGGGDVPGRARCRCVVRNVP
eukprot:gene14936-biopygen14225